MSCFHSLKSAERSDAGQYWCQVEDRGTTKTSPPVSLTVEGEGTWACWLSLVTTPLEKKAQWRKAGSVPSGARLYQAPGPPQHRKTVPTGVWVFENQGCD